MKYWQPHLRLQDWQLQVVFDRAYDGRAACEARPEYKEAVLVFNLERCAAEDEDLEGCVVHEMNHTHTWAQAAVSESLCGTPEHWDLSEKAEEAATTELTLLILHHVPRLFPLAP